MTNTSILLANEIKAIIDTELSKPFPRIPEVKHALRRLGVLLVDISTASEALGREADALRDRLDAIEAAHRKLHGQLIEQQDGLRIRLDA